MSAPKEPFYDERISPLMKQVIELCKEARVNFAAQFSLGYDEETDSTLFCTTVVHDVDPADEKGVERMQELRRVMFPPEPRLLAFTIVSKGPRVNANTGEESE